MIRLHRGPQWSQEAEEALTSGPFTVATGDRMGVRLEGPDVPGGELLSESRRPEPSRCPSGGAPILLLADRQRSAGYDKPAVIHPGDLSLGRSAAPRRDDPLRRRRRPPGSLVQRPHLRRSMRFEGKSVS